MFEQRKGRLDQLLNALAASRVGPGMTQEELAAHISACEVGGGGGGEASGATADRGAGHAGNLFTDVVAFVTSAGVRRDRETGSEFPQIPGILVLGEIGRGGMGVVYWGYEEKPWRRVAIKLLSESASGAPMSALRDRFAREVELAATLRHPNIVSIYGAGEHQGRPYYTMEYIDGVPLDVYVQNQKCTTKERVQLLATVARAVDYAHGRLVLHRDLKPSNIMVDAGGQPRVVDFGLAKTLGEGDRTEVTLSLPGQVIGTLAFMSPEQARGDQSAVGVASDVYGLGAVAYRVLTGRAPVPTDRSIHEMLRHLETIDPSPPSRFVDDISRDLDAVVLKALEKSPGSRYRSAADLAEDLDRTLSGRPVVARPLRAPARAWRWMKRNPAISAVSVGAAVLITSVSAIAILRIIHEQHATQKIAAERLEMLGKTLDALDGVFFEANDALKATPGARETRRALLDKSMSYFSAIAADAERLGLAFRVGAVLGKVGDLARDVHDDAKAKSLYARSLEISERLAIDHATDESATGREIRRQLAFALIRTSVYEEQPEHVLASHKRSVALFEQLAQTSSQDDPASGQAANELGTARALLSASLDSAGLVKEASSAAVLAVEGLARWAEGQPDIPEAASKVGGDLEYACKHCRSEQANRGARRALASLSDRLDRSLAAGPDAANTAAKAQVYVACCFVSLAISGDEQARDDCDRFWISLDVHLRTSGVAMPTVAWCAWHVCQQAEALALQRCLPEARQMYAAAAGWAECAARAGVRNATPQLAVALQGLGGAAVSDGLLEPAAGAYRWYLTLVERGDVWTPSPAVVAAAWRTVGDWEKQRNATAAMEAFGRGVATLESASMMRRLDETEQMILEGLKKRERDLRGVIAGDDGGR